MPWSRSSRILIAANGTVDGVDEWGKRRLAYLINKEAEGYYVLIDFTSVPAFTAELDRIYKITDGVLRSLDHQERSRKRQRKRVI